MSWTATENPGATGRLELPQSLHGQLALLAYDRRRNRFDGDNRPRYGLALRAAMLTDLVMTGHLQDEDGRPNTVGIARPDDPVLRAALDDISAKSYEDWPRAVLDGSQHNAPELVRSQLERAGWLRMERRRVLGIFPATRLRLPNPDLVSVLADRTSTALRNAIGGRHADERSFAVGLLGALGQLPTVVSFKDAERNRDVLHDLALRSVAPINGMLEVVERARTAIWANYQTRELNSGP
ncbi:MAG: hypothetical protein QOD39_155 [Mycobacterium sp.]|jgi:hypothetical protein|nr:hypothetical protein [Mycobacterium sp.]